MRAHGRGGLLLVVPRDTDRLARLDRHNRFSTAVAALFGGCRADAAERRERGTEPTLWQEALEPRRRGDRRPDRRRRRDDHHRQLRAARLRRQDRPPPRLAAGRAGRPSPSRSKAATAVVVIRPQLGGTRHLSAAQFVHDQRDAVALVASQDGRFTVFAWSPCEDMVHAHRVETLLVVKTS